MKYAPIQPKARREATPAKHLRLTMLNENFQSRPCGPCASCARTAPRCGARPTATSRASPESGLGAKNGSGAPVVEASFLVWVVWDVVLLHLSFVFIAEKKKSKKKRRWTSCRRSAAVTPAITSAPTPSSNAAPDASSRPQHSKRRAAKAARQKRKWRPKLAAPQAGVRRPKAKRRPKRRRLPPCLKRTLQQRLCPSLRILPSPGRRRHQYGPATVLRPE